MTRPPPDVDRPDLRSALVERGYAVVPDYLSADELEIVRNDFRVVRRGTTSTGTELPSELRFDDDVMRPLRERLVALIRAVAGPGRRPLLPITIGNYICASEIRYALHCDYGILSPSRDAFKLWIPLIKPDPARAGMTFVRKDRFEEREPELAARIAGRGAAGIKNGTDVVVIGRTVETTRLRAPIEDICETPEVRVGDVVLFRAQDTFHRSQEPSADGGASDAERVAWAFAIRMASEVIDRREVFRGKEKRGFLGKQLTSTVLATSWYHRKNRFTYAELDDFQRRLAARELIPLALLRAAHVVEPVFWKL